MNEDKKYIVRYITSYAYDSGNKFKKLSILKPSHLHPDSPNTVVSKTYLFAVNKVFKQWLSYYKEDKKLLMEYMNQYSLSFNETKFLAILKKLGFEK